MISILLTACETKEDNSALSDFKQIQNQEKPIPNQGIISNPALTLAPDAASEPIAEPTSTTIPTPEPTPSPTPKPTPTPEPTSVVQDDNKSITVYVTKTGSKYHRSGCRYLSKSKIAINLETAKVLYDPCSICKPPQ